MKVNTISSVLVCAVLGLSALARIAAGAEYRTDNFVVTATTPEVARSVGDAAEMCRERLAEEWLGKPLPDWPFPCPITVEDRAPRSSGWTSYRVVGGHVTNWNMKVRGPIEEILTVVVPHEVNHAVLVTHLRRHVPRWADEGAATLAETEAEQQRRRLLAAEILRSRPDVALDAVLESTKYPEDPGERYDFYAIGFSLTDFLVTRGGKRRYIDFLTTAGRSGWQHAASRHYGFRSIDDLETAWTTSTQAGDTTLSASR